MGLFNKKVSEWTLKDVIFAFIAIFAVIAIIFIVIILMAGLCTCISCGSIFSHPTR